ncbi:MAG: SGNH/GDSL hydrolase family protein [Epsilonproteobacteria bacterium]|nr:SGNH/GDSL hydrolase family protein [Campylobacterota bacterium]
MGVILGLGDCNMGGANGYTGPTYLDLVAEALGMELRNRAITMSTTREGRIIFDEEKEADLVVVAYGLVDSWRTFRYAPYVLYYPDNPWRKLARKAVKKYKKLARSLGLNRLLGQKYVVPPAEYLDHLDHMAQSSRRLLLVETPPHLSETFRNPDIRFYNQLMAQIAGRYDHVDLVPLYDLIEPQRHYLDDIHLNRAGYQLVAQEILELL